MQEMEINDLGMVIPDDCTEEQFFAWGKQLGRIEKGMQWAIGDWYNKIPSARGEPVDTEGKRAACEKVGLSYSTARNYGMVAAAYRSSIRIDDLSFAHHQVAAVGSTPEERQEMLMAAKVGHVDEKGKPLNPDKATGKAKPLTRSQMLKVRDKLRGIEPPAPPIGLDEKMERFFADLPKSISKKLRKQFQWFIDRLKEDFWEQVEKEAKKKVAEERAKVDRAAQIVREDEQEIKLERERLARLQQNVTGIMTKEDFAIVRLVCHPDKNSSTELKTKASHLVNKLKDSVDFKGMSKKDLVDAGWD